MGGRRYTSIVARTFFLALWLGALLYAQQKPAETPPEPPEEDETLVKPREYVLNPLQAENEVRIGNYYWKKGSFKAAARRYEEATLWNPGLGEAFVKWGEALEKLNDKKGAAAAFRKFIDLEPESKQAQAMKRKLAGGK